MSQLHNAYNYADTDWERYQNGGKNVILMTEISCWSPGIFMQNSL